MFGGRTNAVLSQEYKEIRRFADITYSGTFQTEANVNRLNEFNLGLENYKSLEQVYGDIGVIDARETDLLVLQEDKISAFVEALSTVPEFASFCVVIIIDRLYGIMISGPILSIRITRRR